MTNYDVVFRWPCPVRGRIETHRWILATSKADVRRQVRGDCPGARFSRIEAIMPQAVAYVDSDGNPHI